MVHVFTAKSPRPARLKAALRPAARSAADDRPALNQALHDQAAPNHHSRKAPAPVRRRPAQIAGVAIVATVIAAHASAQGGQPQDGLAPMPNIVTQTRRPNDAAPAGTPAPLPNVIAPEAGASATRSNDGHFAFNAMVNGRPTLMMLDTGASMVVIRAEDAARLGLPLEKLKYSIKTSTANGPGLAALVTIDTLTVGNITQHEVPALVAGPGMLFENLLGQSFLRNLRQFTVENDRVTLQGK